MSDAAVASRNPTPRIVTIDRRRVGKSGLGVEFRKNGVAVKKLAHVGLCESAPDARQRFGVSRTLYVQGEGKTSYRPSVFESMRKPFFIMPSISRMIGSSSLSGMKPTNARHISSVVSSPQPTVRGGLTGWRGFFSELS